MGVLDYCFGTFGYLISFLKVKSHNPKEMIHYIHGSHLSIKKMQTSNWECPFWPGMTSHIENIVLNCQVCST